eukprot:FR736219.1.p1 GENE.FR736219.1~~FR736219.1.p1  ORF type:complete len:192 (+),score=10.18 FR736219.1:2-577(+)
MRCDHACFPVVDPKQNDVLIGTILRKTLCVLLQEKCFAQTCDDDDVEALSHKKDDHITSSSSLKYNPYNPPVEAVSQSDGRSLPRRRVGYARLQKNYPRFPKIRDVNITGADRMCWLDLRPYINGGPYVVHEGTSLQRTYRLFRTMGLRHLCVVDLQNRVCGIITRKDLTAEALEERGREILQSHGGDVGY